MSGNIDEKLMEKDWFTNDMKKIVNEIMKHNYIDTRTNQIAKDIVESIVRQCVDLSHIALLMQTSLKMKELDSYDLNHYYEMLTDVSYRIWADALILSHVAENELLPVEDKRTAVNFGLSSNNDDKIDFLKRSIDLLEQMKQAKDK